jgi:hypothetical protein
MNAEKPTTQNPVNQTPNPVARRVDAIASGAMELFKSSGSFESELAVAQAVSELRTALSADVMRPVMALMNTDLGFRTDRDPKITPKDKDGNPLAPYPMEVVRECVIEALLRGFHTVGNEWNIIAGRFYACKNGFRRKVVQFAGVTDFKDSYDVPRTVGDKGAIVKARATWRKGGIADRLEREFPIRVNFGMGADAILGKAQRKLLAAVHDRLLGVITPEGDVADVDVQTTKAAPQFAEARPARTEDAAAHEASSPKTSQQELADMVTAAGFTFEDFIHWCGVTDLLRLPTSLKRKHCAAFDQVPEFVAQQLISAKSGFLRSLRLSVPQEAVAKE